MICDKKYKIKTPTPAMPDRLQTIFNHTLRIFNNIVDNVPHTERRGIHNPGVYIQLDKIHIANYKNVKIISWTELR